MKVLIPLSDKRLSHKGQRVVNKVVMVNVDRTIMLRVCVDFVCSVRLISSLCWRRG